MTDTLADQSNVGKPATVQRSTYLLPWRTSTSPTLAVHVAEGCGLGCCSSATRFVPVEEVRARLDQVRSWPSADSIALVGGEPSRHPDILQLVHIASGIRGKVIVCSNGFELNADRIRELREAGAWGINLRINHGQDRPGWRACSESQLEGLRSHYAELVASVGGLLCGFELELADGDFRQLAETLAWAERHVDRVQRVVLHYRLSPDVHSSSARPRDMGENWAPAGWLATTSGDVASDVVWRVGRRGGNVLAASPRLLRLLCEYYRLVRGRSFSYLNPQSLTSQMTCWLAALSDLSLRPLAKEILASARDPRRFPSPRLASQFLFSIEGDEGRTTARCSGDSFDSLSIPLGSAASEGG